MKNKTYTYNVNGFIKGQMIAKNKREVKRYALHLAEMFCPRIGIKSLKIERIKE